MFITWMKRRICTRQDCRVEGTTKEQRLSKTPASEPCRERRKSHKSLTKPWSQRGRKAEVNWTMDGGSSDLRTAFAEVSLLHHTKRNSPGRLCQVTRGTRPDPCARDWGTGGEVNNRIAASRSPRLPDRLALRASREPLPLDLSSLRTCTWLSKGPETQAVLLPTLYILPLSSQHTSSPTPQLPFQSRSATTMAVPPDGVSQSDIWFEDGNVILVAGDVAFRVHRGQLERHSEIFRDLFSLPQPVDQPTFQGSPIIQLYDSPSDITFLLRALYDGL